MKFYLNHKDRRVENPTIEEAERILKEAQNMRASEIITEGGGSLIDIGKYISRALQIPHTVIPTTAGTGSEVTKYCVLTIKGRKTTLIDNKFIPTSYVLDPKKVISLPPLQTLSSGLDALCQAMESMWSIKATNKSKNYSELAVDLVLDNLEKSIKNPTNEEARMNMLIAANFSGRAINVARTNVCHSISYPLTDWYAIPHGIACYMSLRYFGKKIGLEIPNFDIPKYWGVDPERVADVAIQNEKLLDYPEIITREDIVKSLML